MKGDLPTAVRGAARGARLPPCRARRSSRRAVSPISSGYDWRRAGAVAGPAGAGRSGADDGSHGAAGGCPAAAARRRVAQGPVRPIMPHRAGLVDSADDVRLRRIVVVSGQPDGRRPRPGVRIPCFLGPVVPAHTFLALRRELAAFRLLGCHRAHSFASGETGRADPASTGRRTPGGAAVRQFGRGGAGSRNRERAMVAGLSRDGRGCRCSQGGCPSPSG
jgi:hypothetical protein